jgi:hypothetical protein
MSEIEMAEGTIDEVVKPKSRPKPRAKAKKRPAEEEKKKRDPRTMRDVARKAPRAAGRQVIALDGDVITLIRKKQGEIQAKTGRRITMSEAATIAIRGR